MTPDTVLTLYDAQTGLYFNFSRFEIPADIALGGEQMLAKHKLVGGARKIDAMGKDDAPIQWSGMFIGEGADDRALYINGLRVAGRKLTLTWHKFNYDVVISTFHYNYQQYYRLPYSIAFEVVQDNTDPVRSVVSAGVDAALASDMLNANSLGLAIGDAQVTALLDTLDSGLKVLNTMATATQSAINNVVGPIQKIQGRLGTLTSSAGNIVSNASTLGGATAGGQTLLSSSLAFGNMGNMLNLNGVMGRMLRNVRGIPHA